MRRFESVLRLSNVGTTSLLLIQQNIADDLLFHPYPILQHTCKLCNCPQQFECPAVLPQVPNECLKTWLSLTRGASAKHTFRSTLLDVLRVTLEFHIKKNIQRSHKVRLPLTFTTSDASERLSTLSAWLLLLLSPTCCMKKNSFSWTRKN